MKRLGHRNGVGWAAGIIAGAALLAYRNTYHSPFEFDDIPGILQNRTIEHLGALKSVLRPPLDLTVSGRPVLNLSFAINYAISGTQVWSYHVANLAIHILAGLTLFGIARRMLAGVRARAGFLALSIALIWTLHPLQTESVTYIVQRAESLMGLFYLLTLYCFIRYCDSGGLRWACFCFTACLLGMGTKEVMVSAPVTLLLYDWTFAPNFREAWRKHWKLHVALAATWIPLLLLVFSTRERNGTAGFGIGVSWRQYALSQAPAVVRYLRLSFIPVGQIFDYGNQWVRLNAAVVRDLIIVFALGGVAVVGIIRRRAVGFLGFWFFAILAPTSLIPGNRQTLAEHRMYLALAAVVAVVVLIGDRCYERWRVRRAAPIAAFLALAIALGWLTERRNELYRSDLALWDDTVAHCPSNPYARNNLGNMLLQHGQVALAVREYRIALELKPDYAESRNNLGTALVNSGKIGEAEAEFNAVLGQSNAHLASGYGAEVHNNLGVALFQSGDTQGALEQFAKALQLKPSYAEAHVNYGNALGRLGRSADAIAQYQEALRLQPGFPEVHNNLANLLLALGRRDEALAEYALAVQLRPDYFEAHNNWGNALLKGGKTSEAISEFAKALHIRPAYVQARFNLANALSAQGRFQEALVQYVITLRIRPDYAEAHNNLGGLLMRAGRVPDAVAQFSTAMGLRPDYPEAHNSLGGALLEEGKAAQAREQIEAALRLSPNYAEAHNNLGNVLVAQKHPAEAEPQFRKALALGLRLPEVHNNLGVTLQLLGRKKEAADEFREALRLNPKFAKAKKNLADLESLGK